MPEIHEETRDPVDRNKKNGFPKFFQITLTILMVLASVYLASIFYVKVLKRSSQPHLYSTEDSADDAFVKAKNQSIQVILHAPTADGIADGYPSLTNLDRSVWYPLKLAKLDNNSDDKLLVSIDVRLGLKSVREHDLFTLWRSAHTLEQLFDLRHAEPLTNGEHLSNKIIFNQESAHLARFYWNNHRKVPLEIRFNFASCQFPFTQASKDLAFVLHVRVLRQSNLEVENYFSQIKLFWPGDAKQANHLANEQLWKVSKQQLAPSSPYTNLIWYTNANLVLLNQPLLYRLQPSNVESFQNQIDESLIELNIAYNKLKYVLERPVTPFVNGSQRGSSIRYLGLFLEEQNSFSIKILLNLEESKDFKQNSLIRTQFELNLDAHNFTKEELMNWYSKNDHKYLLKSNLTESRLTSNVVDVRQNEINKVEIFWRPANQDEIVLTFKINSLSVQFENKPFLFQIRSFLLFNSEGNKIMPLDVATLRVFSVKSGQAESAKKDWLNGNGKNMKIKPSDLPIAVLLINHPVPVPNFFQWLYVFVFTNLARLVSGFIACVNIHVVVKENGLDVQERISLGVLIAAIAFSFYFNLIVFGQLLISNFLYFYIGQYNMKLNNIKTQEKIWLIILSILAIVGLLINEIVWMQLCFALLLCFIINEVIDEGPPRNLSAKIFVVN